MIATTLANAAAGSGRLPSMPIGHANGPATGENAAMLREQFMKQTFIDLIRLGFTETEAQSRLQDPQPWSTQQIRQDLIAELKPQDAA